MRLALYRRRAGRGVRGLGIVGYPASPWQNRFNDGWGGRGGMGIVGYPADGRWMNRWGGGWSGISGLGQTDPYQQWMASLPASCWSGGSWGSGSITCAAPAAVLAATAAEPIHQVSPLNFASSSVQQTANNPTMITAGVSDAPTLTAQTGNLESHLAQQVMYILADPSNAGDPTQNLSQVAQMYCNLYVNTGGGDTQCSQMSALVSKYAAQANQALAAHASAVGGASSGASFSPTQRSTTKTTIVTNPAAKTNAVSSNAPAPAPNPAYQTPQSGNALQPYRYTYSGSVATGQTVLNPYNTVNALPTDTVSNTGAGGPAQLTGDNTWLWVAAIGAGVVLLMMNTGGHA